MSGTEKRPKFTGLDVAAAYAARIAPMLGCWKQRLMRTRSRFIREVSLR
jgi:hypothetical protein